MNRRQFLSLLPAAALVSPQPRVTVPIHLVLDSRANLSPARLRYFWSYLWPEAVRDLTNCGLSLDCTFSVGEVFRPPEREPVISGLDHGAINLVVTHRIPPQWDGARCLGGLTTCYRGHHLCMVALYYAHCHQIPFLAVNTCVHELLHVLLRDIFEPRPPGFLGEAREFRIDYYATRLWLFGEGAAIRDSARAYLQIGDGAPSVPTLASY